MTAQPDRGRFSIFSFLSKADRLSQPKTPTDTRSRNRIRRRSESLEISTPRPVRPSRTGTEQALEDWREMSSRMSAAKPLPGIPLPAEPLASKPLPALPSMNVRPPSTTSLRTIRPVTTVGVDSIGNKDTQHHDGVRIENDAPGQPGVAGHPFMAEPWQAVSSDSLSPIRDRREADLERDSWFGSIGSIITVPTPTTVRIPSPGGYARLDSPTLGPDPLFQDWHDSDSDVLDYTTLQELPFVDYDRLRGDLESPFMPEFQGQPNDYLGADVLMDDTDIPWTTRRYAEVDETRHREIPRTDEDQEPESLEDLIDLVSAYFNQSV